MKEEENKCTALVRREPAPLVPFEPKPLSLKERADAWKERARRSLREALEKGLVGDPITAIVTSSYFIGAAISTGLSVASALITSALTPRQKITEERGRRTGEMIIAAELGILIPEVYAADLSEAQPLTSIWSLCTRQN